MAELREKRAQLRSDLAELGATVREAKKALELAVGRQRQALLALELHRPGESMEDITTDVERWQRQIAACEPRIEAVTEADAVLGVLPTEVVNAADGWLVADP